MYEEENEPQFVPQIDKKSQGIKRDKNIDDLLYGDAKRRQTKVQENAVKSVKQEPQPITQAVSSKSQKLVLSRFSTELKQVLEEEELELGAIIEEEKAIELMQRLGFLLTPLAPSEDQLVQEMWQALSYDEKPVSVWNLKVFMSAIQNFNEKWMKVEEEPAAGEQESPVKAHRVDKSKLGSFNEDKYVIHDAEIAFIAKHYGVWN